MMISQAIEECLLVPQLVPQHPSREHPSRCLLVKFSNICFSSDGLVVSIIWYVFRDPSLAFYFVLVVYGSCGGSTAT